MSRIKQSLEKLSFNESINPTILYRGKGNNNNPTNEFSGGRFYASNIDDASQYGDLIQVVELLPNAKIFKYNNSYNYCEDAGLLDIEYDIIPKLTNGRFNTLRDAWEELAWNGENPNLYYQISQYIIYQELSKRGYDGVEWLYEDDLIPHQYQIWNDKVIKHLKDVDVNGTELKASTEPQKQESLKEDASKDYGTGEAVGDDIFDNKTHIPFYDKILTNPEEMEKTYNLKGEIVQMSPKEYYDECTDKIFGSNFNRERVTFDNLVRSREIDTKTNQEIEDVLRKYKRRLFLPYINYADNTQEGLHRMLVAANLFGWNHKFPVLVVDYADKERAEKDKRNKYENDLKIVLRDVLREAIRYTYSSLDEFKENLPYIVDTKFEFHDYDTSTLKLTINNDDVIISVEGVEETMPIEDIKIVEKDTTDDIDWEDVDIDEDDLVDFDDFDSVMSWLNKNGEQ